MSEIKWIETKTATHAKAGFYVTDSGIICVDNYGYNTLLIPRETFVEAFKKYIEEENE